MIPAQAALARLREGNLRYVADDPVACLCVGHERRSQLLVGQEPFAIILGCSDSRVPAEIIFDQGLGDLFVFRVAGNIVASSQIASVEYAVDRLGVRLVVVLGHNGCGAVAATLQELEVPAEKRSVGLRSIVSRIRPSVETLMETDLRNRPEELMHHAIRANIRSSVLHLRQGSAVLEHYLQKGGLCVVGAEYDLKSGRVDFFEGVSGD